jgi:hypothetical protein
MSSNGPILVTGAAGQLGAVGRTNVAYFSVKPFAILRLILARGSVSQS